MKLDVVFTPTEVEASDVAGRQVVVIDVLRATTVILEALQAGARGVVPVATVEEAMRKTGDLGRDEVVLCGERRSRPIPGFHLGNSPLDFTAERVAGRTLVMTTSNGTPALLAGSVGRVCLVACLRNARAAADAIVADGGDALVLCSGRQGRFALEDALCAGVLVRHIAARATVRPNDAARIARLIARRHGSDAERALRSSAAGRNLARLGFGADIEFCAIQDAHTAVPRYYERRVTLQ